MKLQARIALISACLIVALVIVLSAVQLLQFQQFTQETSRSNVMSMSDALQEQAKEHGRALITYLAELLVNPMYEARMDQVNDIVRTASEQVGMFHVYVYEPAGTVIHDGTRTLANFGAALSGPPVDVLAGTSARTWISGRELHAAAPIHIGDRLIGGVTLAMSLDEIVAGVNALSTSLETASERGRWRFLYSAGLATAVFLIIGALISIILARSLSGPIRSLADLAAKIGRGQYDIRTHIRRSDEIGELAESFTRMSADLQRVDRLKDEFISMVSHELRTPLTSIKGSLDLLSAGATGEQPSDTKRLIGIAKRNSDRLLLIVNDILDSQKIQSGTMDYDIGQVDLGPLLERTIAANQSYADSHDVTFTLVNGIFSARVIADAQRVEQVLTNLLSNAAKFSPSGQSVEVFASRQNGVIRVAVHDDGPGIPSEFSERVFERFAQADMSNTRSGTTGTGLGLNIAKRIIEDMGGNLDYDSEQGRGCTFFFDLPEGIVTGEAK